MRQTLRYRLARTEVTNVQDDASLLVKSQEGSRLVSLVGQTLSYNKLDSRLSLTEGYYASLATQLAGLGGDTRYLRGEAKPATTRLWTRTKANGSPVLGAVSARSPGLARMSVSMSAFSWAARVCVGSRHPASSSRRRHR